MRGVSDHSPLNVKGDRLSSICINIVWLHIPVVLCHINASHKYFFPLSIDTYTYNTTKHTCITTIAYDKSVFLYCTLSKQVNKQYSRLQNKEVGEMLLKTASDANVIVHLNI